MLPKHLSTCTWFGPRHWSVSVTEFPRNTNQLMWLQSSVTSYRKTQKSIMWLLRYFIFRNWFRVQKITWSLFCFRCCLCWVLTLEVHYTYVLYTQIFETDRKYEPWPWSWRRKNSVHRKINYEAMGIRLRHKLSPKLVIFSPFLLLDTQVYLFGESYFYFYNIPLMKYIKYLAYIK